MNVRTVTALLLALAVAALTGYAAGQAAGQAAGFRAARVSPAVTRDLAEARAGLAAAQAAERAAQGAEAAVRAGTAGVCWASARGTVTAISAPQIRPGGETCPARTPRFSPAEPQPAGHEIGAPGG